MPAKSARPVDWRRYSLRSICTTAPPGRSVGWSVGWSPSVYTSIIGFYHRRRRRLAPFCDGLQGGTTHKCTPHHQRRCLCPDILCMSHRRPPAVLCAADNRLHATCCSLNARATDKPPRRKHPRQYSHNSPATTRPNDIIRYGIHCPTVVLSRGDNRLHWTRCVWLLHALLTRIRDIDTLGQNPLKRIPLKICGLAVWQNAPGWNCPVIRTNTKIAGMWQLQCFSAK